jgi:hypothetical protein
VSRELDRDATRPYVPDYTEVVVLRFFAYFKQSLTEASAETHRVLFVRICYYAEDDTVMIEEGKQRNSGMPQGVLLRRMRVENPAAEALGATCQISIVFFRKTQVDFILHFFMVDKTIEIWQVLPPNSSRVAVSKFLKKTRLKKPGTSEFYTHQRTCSSGKQSIFLEACSSYMMQTGLQGIGMMRRSGHAIGRRSRSMISTVLTICGRNSTRLIPRARNIYRRTQRRSVSSRCLEC